MILARARSAARGLVAAVAVIGCDPSGGSVQRAERRPIAAGAALCQKSADLARCPADTWPVYAHDARRSGASRGCCRGPLRFLWRFNPPPKPPRNARAFHAVVSRDGVVVSGLIGESPAVFGLGLDGRPSWTFDSRVDITRYEWPAHVLDRVVLDDDGLYILDPRTGEQEVNRGLDSWGQILTDGKTLFATNTWHIAGPKTYVGALEPGGAALWKRQEYGVSREDVMDKLGGLALSGERVLFAPSYANMPGSGLFAYSSRDGEPLWSVGTLPRSHPSVAGDQVVGFERGEGAPRDALVARDVASGSVRWSAPFSSAESTAPVTEAGMIVFRDGGGAVVALRGTDGNEVWRVPARAVQPADVLWATSLAAAAGSRTLIAVDGRDLAVLSLADGQVTWKGRPAELDGAVHSPVIAAGRVYVIDAGGVAALGCAMD